MSAIIEEERWVILSNFSVPSIPHNELKVVEGVMQALNGLEMSEIKIAQLETAVSEAAMNAIEHGNKNNPDLNVDIQVGLNSKMIHISISDQGAGGLIHEFEKPDLEEKLMERQSPRGWGFFLIENMADRIELRHSGGRNIIDMYFYRDHE